MEPVLRCEVSNGCKVFKGLLKSALLVLPVCRLCAVRAKPNVPLVPPVQIELNK